MKGRDLGELSPFKASQQPNSLPLQASLQCQLALWLVMCGWTPCEGGQAGGVGCIPQMCLCLAPLDSLGTFFEWHFYSKARSVRNSKYI